VQAMAAALASQPDDPTSPSGEMPLMLS